MENIEGVIEDPLIKSYLKRFPRQEWNEVIKKTLKLGIHSMNTLQSLTISNLSPQKNVSVIDLEGGLEDDSTIVAESLAKNEGTTPSSKEGTKIIRNDSKIIKKKKALSQVNKAKVSRVTPKAKRSGFEFLRDKKEVKRIHSVKNKGKLDSQRNVVDKEIKDVDNTITDSKAQLVCGKMKDGNCAKSFKSLKKKGLEIVLSPKNQKTSPKNVKNSLGFNELSEFYKNNMSCRNQKVDFPLKIKKTLDMDPFVYITSSSEENSP